jgi:hypothetical protein
MLNFVYSLLQCSSYEKAKLRKETDRVSFCNVLYFAFLFLDAYVYYSAEKGGGL